jgi:hypothetical protein
MKAARSKTSHTPRAPKQRVTHVMNAQEQLDISLQHLLLDDEWDEAGADDALFPDRDFRTVDD